MEGEDQVSSAPSAPTLVLVPYNRAARQVTGDPANRALRCPLPNGSSYGLYISFTNPDKQVFTLGRANADIFVPEPKGTDISKLQCSLTNTENGVVLLEDKSSKRNTELYASNNGGLAIPFTADKRTVLIAKGINNMLALGKERYYQFELHWEYDGLYDLPNKYEPYRTGPRKPRQKKYILVERIGGGSYGTVWRAIDVHTGGYMAVKKFHNLEGKNLEFATREINNLFQINRTNSIHHDHILEILGRAGGEKGDDWGEIFMPLKAGNLKTLVDTTSEDLSGLVLRQMLMALACIAEHKIVHRDIKPENILWEYNAEGFRHFRLGDFGLSNSPALAVTVAGTVPFMAPEVHYRRKQTEKVDIWSLFATIVWVKNIFNFRTTCAKLAAPDVHRGLVQIAQMEDFQGIRAMASMKPKDRPSAARLLRILDGGGDDADDLASSFENVLTFNLEEEVRDNPAGVGPSRSWRPSAHPQDLEEDDEDDAGLPYYEPYPPMPENQHYEWEHGKGKGPATDYALAQMGAVPRRPDGGQMDQAWVASYEQPYGPPDEADPDSGTAVPDIWTARHLPTQDMG